MALTQVYTAVAGDVITAARWNNEFGNIYNNGTDVGFPATKAVSFAGFTITLDSAGVTTITSSGTQGLQYTPGGKTGTPSTTGGILNVVASTYTDNNTAGSGTATAFSANAIQKPTLAASNASVTTTTAATLHIVSQPAAGTNETLTTAAALRVDGTAASSGTNTAAILISTAPSGATNNYTIWDKTAGVARFDGSLQLGAGNTFGIPRSYLAGCTLSTAGSSTTMSIAAGMAVDTTNVSMMTLTALGKTTASWVVGNAQGGLDTGSIANSTWYHFYVIMRVDTGVVDVLFSLSATAPTMPTNYTLKRRIGSGKTDGGGNWTAFTQDGDYFRWAASVLDVNTNNPGTAAVTATMTVPTGVNVYVFGNACLVDAAGGNGYMNISDLAANDEQGSGTAAPLGLVGSGYATAAQNIVSPLPPVRTNTSAQIRYRQGGGGGANVTARIATHGWIDYRGRNA